MALSTTAFEAVLHDHLAADTDLSALVGTRIFPVEATDPTPPYIVYFDVAADDILSTDNQPGTLGDRTLQFSIFAKTAISAVGISEQLRRTLSGFLGELGSPAVDIGVTAFRRQAARREPDTRLFHLPCEVDVLHSQDS